MSTAGCFLLGRPATLSVVPEPLLTTGLPHRAGPGVAARGWGEPQALGRYPDTN